MLSGAAVLPPPAEQRAAIAAARSTPPILPMLTVRFARLAGVEPDPTAWPDLERALMFGPLSPASVRLEGSDATADAPQRTALAARASVASSPDYDPEERGLRDLLLGPCAAAA